MKNFKMLASLFLAGIMSLSLCSCIVILNMQETSEASKASEPNTSTVEQPTIPESAENTEDKALETTSAFEPTEGESASIEDTVQRVTNPSEAPAATEHVHEYGLWEVAKQSTCTDPGIEERTCLQCNHKDTRVIPANGHQYSEWAVVKQPTCTTNGEKEKHCLVCGNRIVEVLGQFQHSYNKTVVNPSCTEGGYTVYKCSSCGKEYKDDYTSALDHNWAEATCTKPKTCRRCSQTEGEATGHKYSEWTMTGRPSVEYPGLETRRCSVCNNTENREIPRLTARNLTLVFIDERGEPIPDGKVSYTVRCNDYFIQKKEVSGYPIAHFADDMIVDIIVPQTVEYKEASKQIVVNGDESITIVLFDRYKYYPVEPSINAVKCGLIFIKQGDSYFKLVAQTGGTQGGKWLYTYSANGAYIGDQYSFGLGPIDKCNVPNLYTRLENKDRPVASESFVQISPTINAVQSGLVYYRIGDCYVPLTVSLGGTTESSQWVYTYSVDGMYLGDQCANGLNPGDICVISPVFSKQ